MDKDIKALFLLVARNGAMVGEKALEGAEKDSKEYINSLAMREKYQALTDKLIAEEPLTQADYVDLYFGATFSLTFIQKNISVWQATAKLYQDKLLPFLKENSALPKPPENPPNFLL